MECVLKAHLGHHEDDLGRGHFVAPVVGPQRSYEVPDNAVQPLPAGFGTGPLSSRLRGTLAWESAAGQGAARLAPCRARTPEKPRTPRLAR